MRLAARHDALCPNSRAAVLNSQDPDLSAGKEAGRDWVTIAGVAAQGACKQLIGALNVCRTWQMLQLFEND